MSSLIEATDIDFQAAAKARIGRSAELLLQLAGLVGPKQTLALVLPDGSTITLPGLDLFNDAKDLAARAEAQRNGLFTIMVCGEFNVGKSTFLNGLLGRKVLPTNIKPTTAVIQVMRYGTSLTVSVYDTNNQVLEELDWASFSEKYVLKKEDHRALSGDRDESATSRLIDDRFQQVSHVVVERDHDLLKNFVQLIDPPGTGESEIRSRKALGFYPKADAIVLLLNAHQLFGNNEQTTIDAIRRKSDTGNYSHVFFVINKMNQLNTEEDRQTLREDYEAELAPLFVDANGRPDTALFHRRVHEVDAYLAQNAVADGNAEGVAASGMAVFQRELERFIASPDAVTSKLAADFELTRRVLRDGAEAIADQKTTLLEPQTINQARRDRVMDMLKDVRIGEPPLIAVSVPAIDKFIRNTGNQIATEVYDNLRDQVRYWREAWTPDDDQLKNIRELVTIREMISDKFHSNADDENSLRGRLSAATKEYVDNRIAEWETGLPEILIEKMTPLRIEQQKLLDDFAEKMAGAKTVWLGLETPISAEKMRLPADPHLGLIGFELGGASDTVISGLGQLIASQITKAIALRLIGLAFPVTAPFVWAGLAISFFSDRNKQINKNMALVRDTLFDSLDQQIREHREEIRDAVRVQFEQQADGISKQLLGQIDQLVAQMDESIAAGESDETVNAGLARYDSIFDGLRVLGEEISLVARGRGLSDEENHELFSQ